MNEVPNLNSVDDDDFGLEDIQPNSNQNNPVTKEATPPAQEPTTETDPNEIDPLLDDNQEPTEQPTLVEALLNKRQINPNSVKFVNDQGEVEETKFEDLPLEDQLEILDSGDSSEEDTLSDDEIELINELRNGSLNAAEYKQYLKQQGIQEYLNSVGAEPTVSTSIDQISDDELFLADLKSRIPDISDEEATAKLDAEKSNLDLYTKEVAGIRELYTQREQEQIALRDQAEAQQMEENQRAYADAIINTIDTDASIDLGDSVIDLSDTEKDNIASFILDTDAAGNRHIAKAFNDPKTLVGMSWYALYGQDAMRQLSEYYRQKITESSKSSYSKGYQDGKTGVNPSRTIVKKQQKGNNGAKSIDEIDF